MHLQRLKWMKKLQSLWGLTLLTIKYYHLLKELFCWFCRCVICPCDVIYQPSRFCLSSCYRNTYFLLVFGGSEVIWGAIFGASIYDDFARGISVISEYRYMIYGIILILMMAYRPQGIIDVSLLKWIKKMIKSRRRGRPWYWN